MATSGGGGGGSNRLTGRSRSQQEVEDYLSRIKLREIFQVMQNMVHSYTTLCVCVCVCVYRVC